MLTFLMLSCREVYKRICVAGTDSMLVESPTEPKWSPSGTVLIFLVDEQTYVQNSLVKFEHVTNKILKFSITEGRLYLHPFLLPQRKVNLCSEYCCGINNHTKVFPTIHLRILWFWTIHDVEACRSIWDLTACMENNGQISHLDC